MFLIINLTHFECQQGRVTQKLSSRGKYVSVNIGPIRVVSSEQVCFLLFHADKRMQSYVICWYMPSIQKDARCLSNHCQKSGGYLKFMGQSLSVMSIPRFTLYLTFALMSSGSSCIQCHEERWQDEVFFVEANQIYAKNQYYMLGFETVAILSCIHIVVICELSFGERRVFLGD